MVQSVVFPETAADSVDSETVQHLGETVLDAIRSLIGDAVPKEDLARGAVVLDYVGHPDVLAPKLTQWLCTEADLDVATTFPVFDVGAIATAALASMLGQKNHMMPYAAL